jgi:hypothetical protein
MVEQETLHPFELAGLGEAPFRFVTVRKNVYSAAPGHQQPGGTCQYCSQGIMYECVIRSSDGKEFVVGQDCVMKLDRADNRLVSQVKRAKLQIERERREAIRAEKYRLQEITREAEMNRQREANGGLTDWEVAAKQKAAERAAGRKQWIAKNEWLYRVLEAGYRSSFIEGMLDSLECGPVSELPERAIAILQDIYAKSHGRRGSKAYAAAEAEFESKVENEG